jgi:hypothetical protein
MTLADDANIPIRFKGQKYKPLTLADIAELIETIPERLMPHRLLLFVGVYDALKFGRSPYGLPELMKLVSDKSGHKHALSLAPGDQLQLAGLLTDRFYGLDPIDLVGDAADDDDAGEGPQHFQDGPASSPTSPT